MATTQKTGGVIDTLSLASMGASLAGKEIPFLGSGISALSAGNRLLHGDFVGSGIDLAAAATNPFVGLGTAASTGLNLVNLARDLTAPEARHVNVSPNNNDFPTMSAGRRQLHEENEASKLRDMKVANFSQDIGDASSATSSDFYKTLQPMLGTPTDARSAKLHDEVLKGITGLEYLTGQKHNTGETFYDAHPAEAVATDVTRYAAPLGLATALGIAGVNNRRQSANMHKTEPAAMSRTGNIQDPSNPANLLNAKGDNIRPDISRMFGDLEENLPQRLQLLDAVSGRGPAGGMHEALQNIQAQRAALSADPKANKAALKALDEAHASLVNQARNSAEAAGLHKYIDLHESLSRANAAGGLKGRVGESIGSLGAVGDLIEKRHITGAHPHYHEGLLRKILEENMGSHVTPAQMEEFVTHHLPKFKSPTHQSSGLVKGLRRLHVPAKVGLGIAAGGVGLHQLLKYIQSQSYSANQRNEWNKTRLKAKGDFDGAKRLEQEGNQAYA